MFRARPFASFRPYSSITGFLFGLLRIICIPITLLSIVFEAYQLSIAIIQIMNQEIKMIFIIHSFSIRFFAFFILIGFFLDRTTFIFFLSKV